MSYRLTVRNLNPLLTQQLYPQNIGKVNGSEVKQSYHHSNKINRIQ